MELMVYIAIAGLIVLVAGNAYSGSTKMRVRTQSMLKATETAENIGTLLKDDVAQMGAKSAIKTNTTEFAEAESQHIYIDANNATDSKKDSSSFRIVSQTGSCPAAGCNTDTLAIRRVRYNTNGEREAEEEVRWIFANGKLLRNCKTLNASAGTEDCPVNPGLTVEFADGVSEFRAIPAKPGVVSADYAALPSATNKKQYPRLLPSATDTSVHSFRLVAREGDGDFYPLSVVNSVEGRQSTLSNFATNYNFETENPENTGRKANQVFVAPFGDEDGNWKDLCTKIDSLEAGTVYEISFAIPYVDNNSSSTFRPGEDHMSVGFRKINDGSTINGLEDFLFYPPTDGDADDVRKIRFTTQSNVKDVCLAFTFVFYSPIAGAGTIAIRDVKLNRVESANYEFDPSWTPSIKDKQNVKAFKLELNILRNGEAGHISLVVPTPSNGPRD